MTVEVKTYERYEVTLSGDLDEIIMVAGTLVRDRKAMGHTVHKATFEGVAVGVNELHLGFTIKEASK